MTTKTCAACGSRKPMDEYYAHPLTADRRLGVCKECHKLRMTLRRRTNPNVQAYDRQRAKRPHVKARIRANAIKWKKENPDGYKAQNALNNAIRDGRAFKGICEVCGRADNLHAHHTDYSKPLEVQWLCAIHHHRLHASQTKGGTQ